jgi:FkbM family methyltransferase
MIHSIKQIIVKLLKRRGYHLHGIGYLPETFLELLLYELLNKNSSLTFIQIGANDGINFDPLHNFIKENHHRVKGLVIEPLSDYFKQLSFNYRDYPNITPLEIAVHNTEKEMPIYRVSPDCLSDYPPWVTGASSFNKEKLVVSDKIDPRVIISEMVACKSLNQLVREYKFDSIDLLQIDTEGYDFNIISEIDFSLFVPKLIHFEHGIAKEIMSRQELNSLRNLLHQNGYELWLTDWDALAYQTDCVINFSP